MLIAIVLFLVVFAVFYLFGSPKPASAAAAALVTAGQRAAKFFLVMFVISGVAIAVACYNDHVKSTERKAKEKASNSIKWDEPLDLQPVKRDYILDRVPYPSADKDRDYFIKKYPSIPRR